MESILNDKPMVIFAQSPDERDYLRNLLSTVGKRVLCFEKETICLDNLASIDPQLILVRSDSSIIVWRFIFALSAFKFDGPLLLLSNLLEAKSFGSNDLGMAIHRLPFICESNILVDTIRQLLTGSLSPSSRHRDALLVGVSPIIRRINSKLPSLKQTSDPILIEGETGTGKELLAGLIANRSSNHSIYIKIDCDALTKRKSGDSGQSLYCEIGEFFRTDDGNKKQMTILLAKIDRLDQRAQSEILLFWEKDAHALANWRIDDVRFIATSEADLGHMVRYNSFRKELFYRLNVIPVQMPALRERREDIPLLMDHFAVEACIQLKRSFMFSTPYMAEQLSAYNWPGNLDELKCAMDRLAASGDEMQLLRKSGFQKLKQNPHRFFGNAISMDSISDSSEIQNYLSTIGSISLKSICDRFTHRTEKKILRKALETTNWNRKKAAALLHISYKSMLNKIKMYEII